MSDELRLRRSALYHQQADARQAAGCLRTPPKQLERMCEKHRAAVEQECRCRTCRKTRVVKATAMAKYRHKLRGSS